VVDEHVLGRPAPALAGLVAAYSGYRQRGVAPALHRGLPSPYLTLIFTIDEPLTIVAHVDRDQPPGNYDALVGGLHLTPAYIRHDGAQSGVQVHLSPLAARPLLGLPAGELAGLDFAADLLLGSLVDQVRDGLSRAADWPARFAVLDRALLRHARDGAAVPDEVRFAWSRLLRSGGGIGVADLAAETGWSDRHLAAMLRRETGLTTKRAARVIRFDRARQTLQRVGASRLADVAADCGYVDQSHMSRDFVAMTDIPPGRWLAAEFGSEEFGKVQSHTLVDDAGWQS
jgi:AraC-like DNA-binding protein